MMGAPSLPPAGEVPPKGAEGGRSHVTAARRFWADTPPYGGRAVLAARKHRKGAQQEQHFPLRTR